MMRWVNLAFGAFFTVLMASILGLMVTLFDAVEWQPFFFKSFLGSLAVVLVLGLIEAFSERSES
jgi:hypothetical protein